VLRLRTDGEGAAPGRPEAAALVRPQAAAPGAARGAT
jgi:hypothetical protein